MVSKKRAFAAVIVTALVTEKLCKLGFGDILLRIDEEHKSANTKAWSDGFDAGHKAALDDRYAVSQRYMRNATLMELN